MMKALFCAVALLVALQLSGARAQCATDGNLEVQQPPLLDEDHTGVTFQGADAEMGVRIIVPVQYETVEISFDGALSDGATFDSQSSLLNLYWRANDTLIACNVVYDAVIPWDLFRTSLGGMVETRMSDVVYYSTEIVIEVTRNLTLTPETLLLEEDQGVDLLQGSNNTWPQHRVRRVTTRIPFEIAFDLELSLEGNTTVIYVPDPPTNTTPTNFLRVSAAVTESSVIHVNPSAMSGEPLATADIVLVTILPLPLQLDNATIAVNDGLLANQLVINELEDRRDCNNSGAYCTQFWLVRVNPEKCNMNGDFVANVSGSCHPDAQNCIDPNPNYAEIYMNMTSDNFCGHSQQVSIMGALGLSATTCNGAMQGVVSVVNPDGGAINNTEIVELRVSPTLSNPTNDSFLTVHDFMTDVLNYSATMTQPDQVDFSFTWEGGQLRCDVVATVEVVVQVEFQATRPLLLSVGSAKGAELQQTDTADNAVRMSSYSRVSAAIDETGATRGGETATRIGQIAGAMSGTLAYVVIGVLAALVLIIAAVTYLYLRHLKNKTKAKAAVFNDDRNTRGAVNSAVSDASDVSEAQTPVVEEAAEMVSAPEVETVATPELEASA